MEGNPDKTEYAADDEINIIDLVKVVWKHKGLIIGIVFVAVMAVATDAFLQSGMRMYEAKAVIITAASRDPYMASRLAGQFGLVPPASPMSSEIVSILKSDTLTERIIVNNNLMPILLPKKQNTAQWDDNKRMWAGINALKGMTKIAISKDKDSGLAGLAGIANTANTVIELSIRYKDPKMAADLVNMTLNALTEYMSGEVRRVAEINKKYLESQIDKTLDPFIRTKIYSLIAQQIETAMMAEVKENFAFKVLDPPRVPVRAIGTNSLRRVLMSFMVSLFLGICAAFGKEYFMKMKEKGFK